MTCPWSERFKAVLEAGRRFYGMPRSVVLVVLTAAFADTVGRWYPTGGLMLVKSG